MNLRSGSVRYFLFPLLAPLFILFLFQNKYRSKPDLFLMNLRILFGLAHTNPDCVSSRHDIVSGDQPLLSFLSTNLVRWPSQATLLQLRFLRYCFQYAFRIALFALYSFLPPFALTSSLIVDSPLLRALAISLKLSPTPSIFSMQNLSSSDKCFFLLAIYLMIPTLRI